MSKIRKIQSGAPLTRFPEHKKMKKIETGAPSARLQTTKCCNLKNKEKLKPEMLSPEQRNIRGAKKWAEPREGSSQAPPTYFRVSPRRKILKWGDENIGLSGKKISFFFFFFWDRSKQEKENTSNFFSGISFFFVGKTDLKWDYGLGWGVRSDKIKTKK